MCQRHVEREGKRERFIKSKLWYKNTIFQEDEACREVVEEDICQNELMTKTENLSLRQVTSETPPTELRNLVLGLIKIRESLTASISKNEVALREENTKDVERHG